MLVTFYQSTWCHSPEDITIVTSTVTSKIIFSIICHVVTDTMEYSASKHHRIRTFMGQNITDIFVLICRVAGKMIEHKVLTLLLHNLPRKCKRHKLRNKDSHYGTYPPSQFSTLLVTLIQ